MSRIPYDRTPGGAETEVTLLSHEDELALDCCADGWHLSFSTTGESCKLPVAAGYELVLDAVSGRGKLLHLSEAGDITVRDPREFLKRDIGIAADGSYHVMTSSSSSSSSTGTRLQSYADLRSRFKDADVTLSLPDNVELVHSKTHVFSWQHASGCRVVWSLWEAYRLMQLTSYQGVRSRWVNESYHAWFRQLHQYYPCEGMHFTNHGNTRHVADVPKYFQCLPEPGVTTVCFVALLVMWSAAKGHECGFKSPTDRRAAVRFANVLLTKACATPHVFDLLLEPRWVSVWPRPHFRGCHGDHNSVRLVLLPPCSVDVSGICRSASGAFPGFQTLVEDVARMHQLEYDDKHVVDLYGLMTMLLNTQTWKPLFYQLCWHVACACEASIAKVMDGTVADGMGMELGSGMPACGETDMERKLFRYVGAGKTASIDRRVYSFITDKMSPAKQNLQNSAVLWPGNIALVLMPQVIF